MLLGFQLLFEIALAGTVAYLQQEAEKDAQRAIKAHAISDCINRLTGDLYDLWIAVGSSSKSSWLETGYLQKTYHGTVNKLRADYKELDQLTADQPELNAVARQSNTTVTRATEILDKGVAALEAGDLPLVLQINREHYAQLKGMFKSVISQELKLVERHEREVSKYSQERQALIRHQLLQLSTTALIINIIFNLVIAFLLVKGITSRLKVMTANTRLFSQRQALHLPIGGGDELAELDKSFHQMTEKLLETENQHQEIVNMITHDMRSPLTVIQGCLDMLNARQLGTLNDKGNQLAPLAEKNCKRVMQLVNDLLDIEKIKSGMMPVDQSKFFINELFEEVNQTLSVWLAEAGIKLKIADSDAYVLADKDLAARVIFNLVSNAVNYSHRGDTISLNAEQVEDWVEVSVRDQGKGVPLEMQKAIFERFQQVEDHQNGTGGHGGHIGSGLGLTICKSIINLHGGEIWVESKRGEGSNFLFTLPAVNA